MWNPIADAARPVFLTRYVFEPSPRCTALPKAPDSPAPAPAPMRSVGFNSFSPISLPGVSPPSLSPAPEEAAAAFAPVEQSPEDKLIPRVSGSCVDSLLTLTLAPEQRAFHTAGAPSLWMGRLIDSPPGLESVIL